LRAASPAILIAVAMLLPYLNKAFLVDDPHFLMMARQILSSPLRPMNFEVCWNSPLTCEKASAMTVANTLMGYALVPAVLAGTSELVAHLSQILFALTALLAMASIMLRQGFSLGEARLGTVLLVATPPFLPMASTAMPDTLALTVALLGIERLLAWKQDRHWLQGATAAVGIGLAGVARMHLTLLVPLAAILVIEPTGPRQIFPELRRKWRALVPVGAAGLVLAAFLAITREPSLGGLPPAAFTGLHNVPPNLVAYLLYLALPLPLGVCRLATRLRERRFLAAGTALSAVVGALFLDWRVGFMLLGAWTLCDLMIDVVRRWDYQGIALTMWLLLPVPAVYYGHLPIKYFLPCLPAIIMLCMRWAREFSPAVAQRGGIALAAILLAYSGVIVHADSEYANRPREALRALVQPHIRAGETVWVSGHYYSYFYAVEWGARVIGLNNLTPRPGDLIVQGVREGGKLFQFPKRGLVQSISFPYTFGRTMYDGAGLYSNRLGLLLWTVSASQSDRFELWRVE
jgi:hypothetical protein